MRTDFKQETVDEAHKSDCSYQHGCVIVYQGKIIGRGYNYYRRAGNVIPLWGHNVHGSYMIHAEIAAICDAKKNGYSTKIFSKCHMYVARLPASKNPKIYNWCDCPNSHPCVNCYPIIKKLKFEFVYFTDK